jgi:hypothetical protein
MEYLIPLCKIYDRIYPCWRRKLCRLYNNTHRWKWPGWLNEFVSWITGLSSIRRGFAPGFVNYKKGALDSQLQVIVYQLLAHGRWFSPSTPASSTTKTGRHDIAEILLKVALSTINQIKSKHIVGKYKINLYDL